MYSQQPYPVVDNTVYPLQQQPYQHLQQQQQQHHEQQQQQQQQHRLHQGLIQQRNEPLPSATDAKPNITLSITEIAEFSSTMVYLMWHARRQSVMDLHSSSKVNGITHSNNNLEQTRVTADMANMTSAAFKKFCKQILSATQLSESVVLLSLKYIAMLLQNNPNIQGADGSEYRLFTVALMLANKFLDDNTFTNKTWSEVSGMKVIDLNIMELEFLDVLRFKLSIRKEEYERWRTALFGFRTQLINVPIEIQRQKLMETMALSVGNQQQWVQPQQVTMQQQQHVAAVAAASHNFYLFSKAQQQFPVQPTFNGPLARVPLRIPTRPVYHNIQTTPSAPPNLMYDNRNTSSIIPTSSPSNPIQHQHRYSATSNRRPAETNGYAPYQKQPQPQQQQQQPRIPTSTNLPSNTSSIISSRPTTPSSSLYPQQQQQPSPYSTQSSYTRSYPTNTIPNTNANTRANHRTSSLPQQGGLELNVKNSSYYYTTPSPTNNNTIYQQQQQHQQQYQHQQQHHEQLQQQQQHHEQLQQQQQQQQQTAQYPTTTSYYVDPQVQPPLRRCDY